MAIPRLRLLDGCRSEPTASNGVVRSDPTSASGLCRSRSVQPLGEFVEARLLCLRPAQGVPHLGVVLRWAPAPGGELFAVRASVDSDAETLWSLADHAPADRTLDARSHRVAVGRGRVNSLRRHFQILGLKSVFGLIERPAAVAPRWVATARSRLRRSRNPRPRARLRLPAGSHRSHIRKGSLRVGVYARRLWRRSYGILAARVVPGDGGSSQTYRTPEKRVGLNGRGRSHDCAPTEKLRIPPAYRME